MQVDSIKQWGARRTGTNVLCLYVLNTFGVPVQTNTPVHKHDALYDRVDFCKLYWGHLISIRHPYAWFPSYFNFGKQLRRRPDWREKNVRELCRNFNKRYANWLTIPQPKEIVRIEDLIENPQKVMDRVGKRFGLMQKTFTRVTNTIGPNLQQSEKTFEEDRYTGHHYLDEIPEPSMKVIQDAINWDLMSQLGYHI